MTKHREYKILRQQFFWGHGSQPPKNTLYHTVQMVLVDPSDWLIYLFNYDR